MLRRVFTALLALSLVLFVATVVLWVRSYFAGDVVYWARGRDLVMAGVGGGHVVVSGCRLGPGREPWEPAGMSYRRGTPGSGRMPSLPATRSSWSFAGFAWTNASMPDAGQVLFRLPLWAPCVLVAGAACLFWMKRRPFRAGLCPSCGYDLRATPGRCPECGVIPAREETPTSS